LFICVGGCDEFFAAAASVSNVAGYAAESRRRNVRRDNDLRIGFALEQ